MNTVNAGDMYSHVVRHVVAPLWAWRDRSPYLREYISGISLTENFAMVLEGVKQMQIVQDALDHLLFRVVQGENGQDQTLLTDIVRLVQERFGSSMRHDVEYVDSIQSETSCKYRFCASKLDGAGVFGAGL